MQRGWRTGGKLLIRVSPGALRELDLTIGRAKLPGKHDGGPFRGWHTKVLR
jgi:hypothetical protein